MSRSAVRVRSRAFLFAMIKSLYIHIPFCKKRCFYCDFYSQTKLNLKKDYLEKLRVEAAAEKEIPHKLKSIYIGGGTPSLLTVSEIDFLFANVIGVFRRGKKCEITSEVNPESACDKKLLSLEKHGVNRLSIGFQFLDDSLLKKAGRLHTEKQAVKTFLLARETGFKNINIDIIYGFPGQSLKSFTETLDKIISLKPEHISAYLYSPPERKSPLRGKVPDENLSFKMYRHLCEKLKKNDFIHYEISNFARKNFYSEHNLNYWKGNDYIGLGAGAVSTVGNIRIKIPR